MNVYYRSSSTYYHHFLVKMSLLFGKEKKTLYNFIPNGNSKVKRRKIFEKLILILCEWKESTNFLNALRIHAFTSGKKK